MPLVQAFTISQSALLPGSVTAVDTSTGSDVAVSKRRIFFQTSAGTYLVEDGVLTQYNEWPLADTSKTFAILDNDAGVSVTVQWLSAADSVLYTLTQLYTLAEFNKNFLYYLIQQQALSPSIPQDANYFSNLATYWMNITGAIQAVEIGADIAAAQACLDRATSMKDNQFVNF